MTRTTKNVFRLDFAYAIDPDPLGRQGWLVSFSGGQAFQRAGEWGAGRGT